MPAAQQIDMFSRLAVAPVQGPAVGPSTISPPEKQREFIPTPPTLEWAKLLARSEVGHETIIFVSHLWTGVVKEVLCDPQLGRLLLEKEGRIREIPPDRGARGRVVYMDARQALDLHARRRLVPIGSGGSSARQYRLAQPGERVPELLALPPAADDCE